MPIRLVFMPVLLVFWHHLLPGQSEIRVGLGDSFIAEGFPEGRSYHVWLASCGYAWRFIPLGEHTSVNGIVDVQYGDATTLSHGKYDFDIAANFTLELLWRLHHSVDFVAAIGSGPGYQSSTSIVQARGMIFSNNFSTGFRFTLAKGAICLSPQIRFRHMSNAGIKSPNQGIDNFLLLVTMGVPIGKN